MTRRYISNRFLSPGLMAAALLMTACGGEFTALSFQHDGATADAGGAAGPIPDAGSSGGATGETSDAEPDGGTGAGGDAGNASAGGAAPAGGSPGSGGRGPVASGGAAASGGTLGSGGHPGVCAPGAHECVAGAARLCTTEGEWLTTKCAFVCSGGACDGECLPGAKRCGTGGAELCGTDGLWGPSAPCDFVCDEGECTGECQPAAGSCTFQAQPAIPYYTWKLCGADGRWTAGRCANYVGCSNGSCTN